jgi:hypothetical protein
VTPLTMAELSLVIETERSLAALDPPPQHAGLVALVRMYAAAIMEDPTALASLGPKLLITMTKLGALARPRPAPVELPAAAPAPAAPTAVDEIRQRREQRAARRTG